MLAADPQFRSAEQLPAVIEAARQPGVRLATLRQTLTDAYAGRPALGWQKRELTTDSAPGRTTGRLLPEFDTITYHGGEPMGHFPHSATPPPANSSVDRG